MSVLLRVKAIYAPHPSKLEKDVNEYLENMTDKLSEIKFDHGTITYENGEQRTLYTAYITHYPSYCED